ncbi:hypothetical protein [uncultured Desulfobacter sp.]|uniref:hypothetical protein n=1 Tax=uncultured Desulfobacter sp. TaxID=240139 RepID=UPI002AA7F9A4|nr:hypothetical protein [uncultured Desulfobacter sp.]
MYQYYHGYVTQPLILEQLREYGISISSGQINAIVTENKKQYHEEKDEILSAGLKFSSHINVDDTGARHNGKNGYCTHIGNNFFAWFKSTDSKNRINFLQLLRCNHKDYVINDAAIEYMKQQRLPKFQLEKFQNQCFSTERNWKSFLFQNKIRKKRHKRIATEGALLGSLLDHGWNQDLAIISDDAGQFNILTHALCWVHAERTIQKLIGFTQKRKDQDRGQVLNYKFFEKIMTGHPLKRRVKSILMEFYSQCLPTIFYEISCFGLNLNRLPFSLLIAHH